LQITNITLRKSFTSRGDATVEATVEVGSYQATVTAPAGASTGEHEAQHLPVGGFESVLRSFRKEMLLGVDPLDLKSVSEVLKKMDGTKNFSKIGGSTAFAVSVASAIAGARAYNTQFFVTFKFKHQIPFPIGNVLGGGKHAGPGSPDIQEFLSSPVGAKSVFEAVSANIAVHREVLKEIEKRDPTFAGGKGDEGAWAANLKDEEALDLVRSSIDAVSRQLGIRIIMGIDMASSTFFENGYYNYSRKGKKLNGEEQLAYVESIVKKYDLKYVEDPFDEEDFEMFARFTKSVKCMVVGDDIFVTDKERLKRGIDLGAGNGVILKVNQVGTLYDAELFAEEAEGAGYTVIASHRSGDTCDPYLAHMAVGLGAGLMKSGVVGGERISKLIELSKINDNNPQIPLWRTVV
jgi:enolase